MLDRNSATAIHVDPFMDLICIFSARLRNPHRMEYAVTAEQSNAAYWPLVGLRVGLKLDIFAPN